jgi:hypothetical protein
MVVNPIEDFSAKEASGFDLQSNIRTLAGAAERAFLTFSRTGEESRLHTVTDSDGDLRRRPTSATGNWESA